MILIYFTREIGPLAYDLAPLLLAVQYVTDVCTDDGAPADHCAVCGRSFEDEEVS